MARRITKQSDIRNSRVINPREGLQMYIELRNEVTKSKILKRSYIYYFFITCLEFLGFGFFLYQLVIQRNPWLTFFTSLGIAFFSVRIGGLIHDAGHRAIFRSTKLNDLFGYFCSFIIAFPYSVWRVKHNAHHANVNEEDEDPDLEIPFSFTERSYKRNNFFVKVVRKYQVWLYYLLGPLVSFTIRLKSFWFYRKNFTPRLSVEILLLVFGLAVWYIVPFYIFPFWKALLFFVVINFVGGFYMLNIFAPNHKGMPQLKKGLKLSFVEHQIITSRNIYGHWLTDYMYLGLNYQIEHHLFPNCPRNKLHLLTPLIKKFCQKYRLAYTSMSFLDSNRFILSELNAVSQTKK